MAAERSEVAALVERLAEILLRLISDRFELARFELEESATRILRVLVLAVCGALLCAVGVGLAAAALAQALAPLVASAALGLLVVGGPLVLVGGLAVRAALGRLSAQRPEGQLVAEGPLKRSVAERPEQIDPAHARIAERRL